MPAGLLIFYKALLERTSLHQFKRFYLLAATMLSFVIPLVTFTYEVVIPLGDYSERIVLPEEEVVSTWTDYLPSVLWSIYGLGVLIFGIKFGKNLLALGSKIRKNPKQQMLDVTNVLLKDVVPPHTFFRYIFLNKHKYETRQIPKSVLLHEYTHARERHSLDVVIVEILQVLFWFNPLVYILKRSIKLNHEFLADRAVLKEGVGTSEYQQTLLAFSSSAGYSPLANSINYSLIKKRFTVMKTQTSNRARWALTLLLAPLVGLLLYGFSNKVPVPLYESETEEIPEIYLDETPEAEVILTSEMMQEKATKKMVNEYNELARKYNNMSKNNMRIHYKDVERMQYIYGIMSDDQRENAEPYPDLPEPPPPPPPAPKADEPKDKVVPDLPPPPPPPPIAPDGISEEEKKKYKEAQENYEKALKVYEESKSDNRAAAEVYMEALKAREKEMSKYLEQAKVKEEKIKRQYEKELQRVKENKEDIDGERLARLEKRTMEIARRSEARAARLADRNERMSEDRLERLTERQAKLADELRRREMERSKERKNRMKERTLRNEERMKDRVKKRKERKERKETDEDDDGIPELDIRVNPNFNVEPKLSVAVPLTTKLAEPSVVTNFSPRLSVKTEIAKPVIKTNYDLSVKAKFALPVEDDTPQEENDDN